MAASTQHRSVPLIHASTLMTAAVVSLLTMILLVIYWFVLGALISLLGCVLAYRADTPTRAIRGSRILSAGLGLLAGPAVYFSLAVLSTIA